MLALSLGALGAGGGCDKGANEEVRRLQARLHEVEADLAREKEFSALRVRLAEAQRVNERNLASIGLTRETQAANRIYDPTADLMHLLVDEVLTPNVDAMRAVLTAGKIKDAWGNTVVFFPKERYDRPVEVTNIIGEKVEVRARKRTDGTYHNADTFQIHCLGPDGVPGTGDDITNFEAEEREGGR